VPGTRLPMFPLSAVLFPHATIPLHVFEARYRTLTRDCLDGDRRFGVALIERGSEVGGGDQRSMVGTRGVITRAAGLTDGRWLLEVRGEARIAVAEWLPDDPYPLALVQESNPVADLSVSGAQGLLEQAAQRVRRARALLSEHGEVPPLPPAVRLDGGGDAEVASWQVCAAAPVSAYDAQRLLAAQGTTARLRLLVELMEDLELVLHRMLTEE